MCSGGVTFLPSWVSIKTSVIFLDGSEVVFHSLVFLGVVHVDVSFSSTFVFLSLYLWIFLNNVLGVVCCGFGFVDSLFLWLFGVVVFFFGALSNLDFALENLDKNISFSVFWWCGWVP